MDEDLLISSSIYGIAILGKVIGTNVEDVDISVCV